MKILKNMGVGVENFRMKQGMVLDRTVLGSSAKGRGDSKDSNEDPND